MRNLHSPIEPPFDEFKGEGIPAEEIVARRADVTRGTITIEEIAELLEDHIGPHVDHPWHKLGRCVWCGPCGIRLYNGEMPDDHPVFVRPKRESQADRMRALWGMENR